MKKFALLLPALLLISLLAACGGGSSSPSSQGSSTVTVTVGANGKSADVTAKNRSLLADARHALRSAVEARSAAAAIPANVTDITISITADDITPVVKRIHVAGQPAITETFHVPNGLNRKITVVATDAAGVTQFTGTRFVNLTGTPVTISIPMENVAAPIFAGLVSATATSGTQIQLTWNPASDNVTLPQSMTYLIYQSTSSGGENLSAPTYTTAPGATTFLVSGLQSSTTYFFIVRANNQQGLIDSNTQERSATTLDVTVPTFAGLAAATASTTVPGQVTLSWNPAVDDVTPQNAIVYQIYMSTASGAEARILPDSAPGATSYTVSNLALGTYFFIVRARDQAGNVDANSVERAVSTGSITATLGTTQRAQIFNNFSTPLQVRVTDSTGQPQNVTVTFTAPTSEPTGFFLNGNAGPVTTVTRTTDGGFATTPTVQAGTTVGTYSVTANSSNLPPAVFTLTNLPGPASITAISGTPQLTISNRTFSTPMEARVSDSNNNPLSGIQVIFDLFIILITGAAATFVTGGATATATTDANGIATAPQINPNGSTGTYFVSARVPGNIAPARFDLTSVFRVGMTSATGQVTPVGNVFSVPLQVTLRDNVELGNPIPNAKVTFTSSPGSVFNNGATTITVITNASGVAAVTLITPLATAPFGVTAEVSDMPQQFNIAL